MLVRGIRFHYAFDQSGVRNFDGSGWLIGVQNWIFGADLPRSRRPCPLGESSVSAPIYSSFGGIVA